MLVKKNILFIDIEGGWGGSSRSLYFIIKSLDREKYNPVIVYKKDGPNKDRYSGLGVKTYLIRDLFSFAPREKNSAKIFFANIKDLFLFIPRLQEILGIISYEKIDIVHLNYEGLFLFAKYLKMITKLPVVCHSRTLIPINFWGRKISNILNKYVDEILFISHNEKDRFHDLTNSSRGLIMWNMAEITANYSPYRNKLKRIIFLGNIDYTKGVDRLIELGKELKKKKNNNVLIEIYGAARSETKYIKSLINKVSCLNLSGYISFKGHTAEPEKILDRAYVLIRPSRSNDPWGRDVIESVCKGIPVIATGSYEGVVKDRYNGFLIPSYSHKEMLNKLMLLLDGEVSRDVLSKNCLSSAKKKFGGNAQKLILEKVYGRT